jgi:hypothetical protein
MTDEEWERERAKLEIDLVSGIGMGEPSDKAKDILKGVLPKDYNRPALDKVMLVQGAGLEPAAARVGGRQL